MTDSPLFTPVPVTPRRDGWTPERQRGFIEQLGRCGVVAAAARAVGMTPKSAYALRNRPDAGAFAAAWDEAAERGLGASCSLAIERAIDGVMQPVYRRGRQVGMRRAYNDRLLMAALRQQGPAPSLEDVASSFAAALAALETNMGGPQ